MFFLFDRRYGTLKEFEDVDTLHNWLSDRLDVDDIDKGKGRDFYIIEGQRMELFVEKLMGVRIMGLD